MQNAYKKLEEQAVSLLQQNQTASGAQATGALACVGFNEGSVLAVTAVTDTSEAALPLVMILSIVRACAAAETCALTLEHLASVDELLQKTIFCKLNVPSTTPIH